MHGYSDTDTIDSLLSLSTKDISRMLRKSGLTLGKVEEILRNSPGSIVSGELVWSVRRGHGDPVSSSVGVEIRLDSSGMYLNLIYTLRNGDGEEDRRDSFYFTRRDSNLLPESPVYYLLDPYSVEGGGLCRKVYFYRGGFVSGSFLRSRGILYRQQRESRLGRSVWTPLHRVPEEYPKFIKTHYRGRETSRYRRYCEICDKGERRLEEYLLRRLSNMPYLRPQDLEGDWDTENLWTAL